MSQKKTKVLQILTGGKTFTGVSSYLYQYYKRMDRERIQFDFLFCRENSMEIHMGEPVFKDSRFYPLNAVTRSNSLDYFRFMAGTRRILKENEYDIVIVNTSVIMVVMACLLALPTQKRPVFIAHAHNSDTIFTQNSRRGRSRKLFQVIDSICRYFVVRKADYLFACSKRAGQATFGSFADKSDKFRVINNAIDTAAFSFDRSDRQAVRNEWNVGRETIVFGNVGKLSYGKNQAFLMKVFYSVHEANPKSILWLIGEGPERETLETMIRELNLEDSVFLLGQRNDVHRLMQGMDCFVFTSISEGLGIVAVEAQAAGLPTVVSDGVPEEIMITDRVVQLRLSDGPEEWAKCILGLELPMDETERSVSGVVAKAGYDIEAEARKLTDLLTSFA